MYYFIAPIRFVLTGIQSISVHIGIWQLCGSQSSSMAARVNRLGEFSTFVLFFTSGSFITYFLNAFTSPFNTQAMHMK
jgi:hypothetical protein